MKRRLITIGICLLIIGMLIPQTNILQALFANNAYAVGDLTVNWGVPEGDPIFSVSNMAPGGSEDHTVLVTNSSAASRPIGVRGVLTSDSGDLSSVMQMQIKQGSTILYDKTLSQFFADSASLDGIPLSTLPSGNLTNYQFIVTFQESAGNQFQNKTVVFDLHIGISISIPESCSELDLANITPIFGTSGNDRIQGTSGNDIIFALEGNDRVFGKNGNDCIVGGLGNDEIRGGNGNDTIFGNEGNDLLIGANGDDMIFGGSGDDVIRGENNDDSLHGDAGNDKITGGNGNDTIDAGAGDDIADGENGADFVFGGPGNDELKGGNGTDSLDGGLGSDTMKGGAGNDSLIGGDGLDRANGESGTDTCVAEVKTKCEL